jgi:hypothetical protein
VRLGEASLEVARGIIAAVSASCVAQCPGQARDPMPGSWLYDLSYRLRRALGDRRREPGGVVGEPDTTAFLVTRRA